MKRQSSRKLFHQKAHSPHKKYIYIYFFSDIFFWVSGLEKEKGCSFSWSIFYGREMSIFYEGLGLGLEKWGEVNGVLVNELGKCREKKVSMVFGYPLELTTPKHAFQTRPPWRWLWFLFSFHTFRLQKACHLFGFNCYFISQKYLVTFWRWRSLNETFVFLC